MVACKAPNCVTLSEANIILTMSNISQRLSMQLCVKFKLEWFKDDDDDDDDDDDNNNNNKTKIL